MWRKPILLIALVSIIGCQQAAEPDAALEARIRALEATVSDLSAQLDALEKRSSEDMLSDEAAAAPGMADFTPSRLEWLAVNVAVSNRTANIDKDGYELIFALREPDTLVISAMYAPGKIDPEIVDRAVVIATTDANALAAKHGWDAWLKVEERLVAQGGPL